MKKTLIYALTLLSFILFAFTKGGYEDAMENTLTEMREVRAIPELQAVANKFERIGEAEKSKWLPYYYSAYCYVMMTTQDENIANWDGYLDRADEILDQTIKLKKPDMAEVLALRGFLNMMRITVDPAVRGQEYSMKSAAYLQQAHMINEQNPRVNLMMGQMQFGTAQFFGSGTADACQKFADTKLMFEKEESEKLGILPSWGKYQLESMLRQCASSTKDN